MGMIAVGELVVRFPWVMKQYISELATLLLIASLQWYIAACVPECHAPLQFKRL